MVYCNGLNSVLNKNLTMLYLAKPRKKKKSKMTPFENPELTNILPGKPGVGPNIAMHASPTTKNVFLVLFLSSRSIHRHGLHTLSVHFSGIK